MSHASTRAFLVAMVTVPIVTAGGVGVAVASSGVAVDGRCPLPYVLVPADNDLRQSIDAATGSVDGFVCALELNTNVPFPRNIIDNMVR